MTPDHQLTTSLVLTVTRPEPGILWIALNRPEALNALDRSLGEALLTTLANANHDSSVRVAVLTGTGRAFCSGDDIAAVQAHLAGLRRDSPVVGDTDEPIYLRIIEMIVGAPYPVIAAINGIAAGAGTEIACAADLRIASDQAWLGSCLIQVAQAGSALMLARVVGEARATELFLTGRLVDATEARLIGLIHEVAESESFESVVLERAQALAAAPTRAIALYKELRERLHGMPLVKGLRLQGDFHIRNNREVADAVEGANAFRDKRTPIFTGR